MPSMLRLHCSLQWQKISRKRTLAAVRKVPLFKTFSNAQTHKLVKYLTRRVFEDEDYLITQGDKGTTFYLLVQGKVRVVVNGTQVAELEDGAFFGERALIKEQPRNADVVAVGECLVLEMGMKDFKRFKEAIVDTVETEMEKREGENDDKFETSAAAGEAKRDWPCLALRPVPEPSAVRSRTDVRALRSTCVPPAALEASAADLGGVVALPGEERRAARKRWQEASVGKRCSTLPCRQQYRRFHRRSQPLLW